MKTRKEKINYLKALATGHKPLPDISTFSVWLYDEIEKTYTSVDQKIVQTEEEHIKWMQEQGINESDIITFQ